MIFVFCHILCRTDVSTGTAKNKRGVDGRFDYNNIILYLCNDQKPEAKLRIL